MRMKAVSRIMIDHALRRNLRESYWATRRTAGLVGSLLKSPHQAFVRHMVKDLVRFFLDIHRPIHGQTQERIRSAVDWILHAQAATPDDGVSYGYFPYDGVKSWRPSYPETTGYIISSLLQFAQSASDKNVLQCAVKAANWEVKIQMECGAVQGGPVCTARQQTPAAFNTGMVLDGWSAVYRVTGDKRYLAAGRRAADFLLGDLKEDGYFRTNGQFVAPDQIKTYNCLCSWALYRYGEDAQEERYQKAAVKIVEAALRQQQTNGWFANNCLTQPAAPLVHTICYALQGILEVGVLAKRRDFVSAVERGTDPLIRRLSRRGFLHGRFYADWEPAVFSSCLTGSAQLAVVCYRLYQETSLVKYYTAAERIVNYLKSLQEINSADQFINGALGGSFPLLGGYMTVGYPNWATKYLLDALMLQAHLAKEQGTNERQ